MSGSVNIRRPDFIDDDGSAPINDITFSKVIYPRAQA